MGMIPNDLNMDLILNSKKMTKLLIFITLCLILAHLAGQISRFYFGHGSLFGLVRLFNLDAEKNIPTMYSSFLLFFSSALLALISYVKRKQVAHKYSPWVGLTAIFLFLSIDEMVCLHERFMLPVRHALNTSGYLLFAWVIPYGIGLIVFLLFYWKFILDLPKRTRMLFVIAGLIYIIGAIGFESVGGNHAEIYGLDNVSYVLIATIEEVLEMLGIVVFIYALMSYIASELGDLRIRTS